MKTVKLTPIDASDLIANVFADINLEQQLMDQLVAEITKEIDAEVMATLDTIDLRKLHGIMLKEQRRLPNLITEATALAVYLPYRLSWTKQLGGTTEGWNARLKRFRPSEHWFYATDWEAPDGIFYFQSEDDQVQFLLLMR